MLSENQGLDYTATMNTKYIPRVIILYYRAFNFVFPPPHYQSHKEMRQMKIPLSEEKKVTSSNNLV